MIFFILIVIVMVGIYIYQFLIDDTFLPRIVLDWVIILKDLAIWGILLFFGIMVLQSIIAPIPSEMILFASGLIWGLAGGSVVGYIGSLISASVGYYIAKRGGRPLAVNTIGEKNVESLEYFMSKYGLILVAGMRAIPMVPYDLFTLASGFTQMKIKRYAIATGIGTIPRAIFYSWLGWVTIPNIVDYINIIQTEGYAAAMEWLETSQFAIYFNIVLLVILGVIVIGFIVFYFVVLPYMKRSYKKTQTSE
jgi:uncharacterized membrane protein YdjX (TVP38/TMEM64 family)